MIEGIIEGVVDTADMVTDGIGDGINYAFAEHPIKSISALGAASFLAVMRR